MSSKKNPAAVALGKLAKGVPKTLSKAEIKRRTKRLIDGAKQAKKEK